MPGVVVGWDGLGLVPAGDVEVVGGLVEDGRDHPGPVIVEGWGVAVSFVVTRRE